jgi:hypothetical protein
VKLQYRGWAWEGDSKAKWVNVNGEFWVLSVSERVTTDGHSIDLQIANVDQVVQDEASIVLGRLDAITMKGIQVQPYYSHSCYVYRRELDDTHTAIVPVEFTDAVLALNRCKIRIVTRSFRSTSASAAASGDHQHMMFNATANTGTFGTGYKYEAKNSIGGTVQLLFSDTVGDMYTYEGSGDHTHDIDYGIADDTDTPDTLRIAIDGTDRTAALGGPWAVGGGAANFVLDITNFLTTDLQKKHTITLSCDSGQGEAEVIVDIYETIQSLDLG